MSYDVFVWDPKEVREVRAEECFRAFTDMLETEGLISSDPTPGIESLLHDLLLRWPDTEAATPWASAPIRLDASGPYLFLALVPSCAHMSMTIAEMASHRGLHCFDPQTNASL